MFIENASLQRLNTFGVAVRARYLTTVYSVEALQEVFENPRFSTLPCLVIGGGSNLLLTRDFPGLVVQVAISGRTLWEVAGGRVELRIGAGERWDHFVQWTVEQGLSGLENLSLIPGTVGGAPVQNIGAYGVEIGQVLQAVEVFDRQKRRCYLLSPAECALGYRDSVFKHGAGRALIITHVCFSLSITFKPQLQYPALAQCLQSHSLTALTARQVADAVIALRRQKLPDPGQLGNAGSFFKNPVVSLAHAEQLKQRYPALSYHRLPEGAKISAASLIDSLGWKGRRLRQAGVYEKQPLVLVNFGGASGLEILELAEAIRSDVHHRAGIALEIEPLVV